MHIRVANVRNPLYYASIEGNAPRSLQPPVPVPAQPVAVPRLRMSKLCIAVQGATPAELFAQAEIARKDSVFIEFRLDFLAKPAAALPDLKAFLFRHRDVTAIATCRRKTFGGNFAGSLNAELDMLLKAAEAGAHIVDLEVESAEQATRRNWPSSAPPSAPPAPRF